MPAGETHAGRKGEGRHQAFEKIASVARRHVTLHQQVEKFAKGLRTLPDAVVHRALRWRAREPVLTQAALKRRNSSSSGTHRMTSVCATTSRVVFCTCTREAPGFKLITRAYDDVFSFEFKDLNKLHRHACVFGAKMATSLASTGNLLNGHVL